MNVYSLNQQIPFRLSHPSTTEKSSFASSAASVPSSAYWLGSSPATNRPAGKAMLTAAGVSAPCVWAMVFRLVLLEVCNFCWRWRSSVPAAEEYWEQLLSRSYLAGWLDNSLQPLLEFWANEDFRRSCERELLWLTLRNKKNEIILPLRQLFDASSLLIAKKLEGQVGRERN